MDKTLNAIVNCKCEHIVLMNLLKEKYRYNFSWVIISKTFISALIVIFFIIPSKIQAQNSGDTKYTCTQVIGFSQVGQAGTKDQPGPGFGWYMAGGVFESIVDDDHWQLLWEGGAAVNRWSNPKYEGWNQSIISPCKDNSDAPDRVLFSISGLYGKDMKGWSTAIEKALGTIKQKLPTVKRIILQPVVGGADGNTCPCVSNCDFENSPFQKTFKKVRASWQFKYITKAIEQVVASQKSGLAVKGYFPQVGSCLHYIDGLGHLTKQGAEYVGKSIGNYYK